MEQLRKITVEGTPFEIGFQIGEKAGDLIQNCINHYKKIFEDIYHVPWDKASQLAKNYVEPIKQYDEEIYEEMLGMSKGSGISIKDILTLNARSEIIFSYTKSDGCTTISVVPPTSGHKTWVGQNWDHYEVFKDALVVIEIIQNEKPHILMITEAGIIGKMGVNSNGIAVCLNALGAEGDRDGLPIHVALRGVLNSRNLGEAIGASIQHKSANAANFHIASHEGMAVDIEVSPNHYEVLWNNDILVHTNHFIGSKRINVQDRLQETMPDSHIRLNIAKKHLVDISSNKTIELSDLKDIFQDHHNYPDSICRHGESAGWSLGKRGSELETVFSIITDVSDKKLHIAYGKPCETPYETYEFEKVKENQL